MDPFLVKVTVDPTAQHVEAVQEFAKARMSSATWMVVLSCETSNDAAPVMDNP